MSFLANLFGGARRAAERDLERRLREVRAELQFARDTGDTSALTSLRDRLPMLELTEDEAALELEMAEGLVDTAALRAAFDRGDGLPLVATTHRALNGEPCHFLAPAWQPDGEGDSGGKLLFTTKRLLYLGSHAVALPWVHVASVGDAERDLVVRTRPGRLLTFRCNSFADTLRGAWIGQQLTKR
jgi:hypothetical protein